MDLPHLDAIELNRAALKFVERYGEEIPTRGSLGLAWHDDPSRFAVTFWSNLNEHRCNIRIFYDELPVYNCFFTFDGHVAPEFYAAGSWRDEFLDMAAALQGSR